MWGGSAQTWFQKLSFYAEPSFSILLFKINGLKFLIFAQKQK